MKKRWKLTIEEEHFEPYEAGDETKKSRAEEQVDQLLDRVSIPRIREKKDSAKKNNSKKIDFHPAEPSDLNLENLDQEAIAVETGQKSGELVADQVDLSPIRKDVITDNYDLGMTDGSHVVIEESKKSGHEDSSGKENGWHIGTLNDGLSKRKIKNRTPFLTMFRLMPSQGEVEKYSRLVKGKGFLAKTVSLAGMSKRMELEP